MSHWNQLETQVRSWMPRAPSPSLKARLFGEPAGEAEESSRQFGPAAWHWLAPAMAVFVLGVFVFGHSPGTLHHFTVEPSPNLLATAALAQPEMAAYCASLRHSDNNSLRSTFEWTNDSRSLTTAPPMAQTNSVMQ